MKHAPAILAYILLREKIARDDLLLTPPILPTVDSITACQDPSVANYYYKVRMIFVDAMVLLSLSTTDPVVPLARHQSYLSFHLFFHSVFYLLFFLTF
jgi:hypothetical protein